MSCAHDQLDHGCTGVRFRYITGTAGIAILIQIRLLTFRQSFTSSGVLYLTHYYIASLLEREVYVTISMWLGVGWIDLVRSVGIRGFHGWGNRGKGGCGSRGNAARGSDVAALAVAMETEWWSRSWGDCLVDWPPVIDGVRYHWRFAIAGATPSCRK